uniref:UFSP1/2/DUB catalytic domain-containing protein n=1 Tax=Populus trichocarpa TaxID=3694 RepID=B9IDD1_POPTR
MARGLPGKKGFDALGSHHFNNSVYGSRHWIGTTECASPFDSFGLRARIVDFGPEELQSLFLSVPSTSLPSPLMTTNARGKRKASQVYGPMDRYLVGRNCDVSQLESAVNDKSRSSTNNKAGEIQHDGHSITIVGIQVRRQENKVLQYNLLILDPAHLCPIDPGIANGQEVEQLKKIDGVFIAF